ncbi:MAG: DUF5694 domain-containing protein [Gammaproteobacteria bacterium]
MKINTVLSMISVCVLGGCNNVPGTISHETNNNVTVMVLGTYHMDPQGLDVANIAAADVRTPKRQKELVAVARALAWFNPNVIAVERVGEAPDYVDTHYRKFECNDLLNSKNERTQIAYRLAYGLDIERVYAIDEQPTDDEPDYFPFDKVAASAARLGKSDDFQALVGNLQGKAASFSEQQAVKSIPELLIELNSGELTSPDFYYEMFNFESGEDQPAAELQAYWFMRNAKIFSKLRQVTQPGDRVVVVYGGGHAFWLNHFVDQAPGFTRVDPVTFLSADPVRMSKRYGGTFQPCH